MIAVMTRAPVIGGELYIGRMMRRSCESTRILSSSESVTCAHHRTRLSQPCATAGRSAVTTVPQRSCRRVLHTSRSSLQTTGRAGCCGRRSQTAHRLAPQVPLSIPRRQRKHRRTLQLHLPQRERISVGVAGRKALQHRHRTSQRRDYITIPRRHETRVVRSHTHIHSTHT
jgi:hypothetical protein